MLDDALPLLACPHCRRGLARDGSRVACPTGHSFDVARGSRRPPADGYLSLLPGDARRGTADTAEMVEAREAFLAAGHFQPLAEAIADEATRGPLGDGCVVDLGAGTGWFLARLLDRLPGRVGLALELARPALRRAARAHPRIAAIGCDAWGALPVRDGVAALVLSVFAPRNGPEIARILRRGGALLVVTPTERHLGELVATFGLLTVDARKEDRLRAALGDYLGLERRVEHEWQLDLTPADVLNAVAMGPSARHVAPAALARKASATRVTASVTIWLFRRG